ncbi:MAG TPA: quinone oxidoreductase [Devosiaceae bacterium]|jgi:NADPH2:quinone reductase
MSGLVVNAVGGPEAMEWSDAPVGDPGPGQLKLRHKAIGLNFVDIYQRDGTYKVQTPFVPGNEGAGEVIAVGAGVTDFKSGDRVAYSGVMGAYAEERLISAERCVHVPDGVDMETAAAVMLKGTTAYYLLFETYALRAGDTILFHAAAGGMGQIACQWAKAIGARVIGTAGSAEKVELAKTFGCDAVINYKQEDFVARVRELTGGRGVDVVYDGVGRDTFEGSLDCLRPRGLMVSFGNASGTVAIPNLGILAAKGSLYVTRPTGASYFAKPEDYRIAATAVFEVVKSGAVKVGINARYPLRDAARAHRALENRETTGSVILTP